ncbi:hypothetical protein FRC17_001971 [Serendipita sp. 399]|nr:hypothetical protein FRC17_001971 [Serendipita sp. 399]
MESQQILLAFLSTPAALPFLTSITSRVVPALVRDAYNPHGLARTLMDMVWKELDSLCLGDAEDRHQLNVPPVSNISTRSPSQEQFVREVREYWFTLGGGSNRNAGGAPVLDRASPLANNNNSRSHDIPTIPSPAHVQILATAYNNVAYRWTTDFLLYPIGKRYRQLVSRGHRRRTKPPVVIQRQGAPHAQSQVPEPSSQEPTTQRDEPGAGNSQARNKAHKFHPYERHITATSTSASARARERARLEKEASDTKDETSQLVSEASPASIASVLTRERVGTATTTSTGISHPPRSRRKRRFPLPRRSPTGPENSDNVLPTDPVPAAPPTTSTKADHVEMKIETEFNVRESGIHHIDVAPKDEEDGGLEGCKVVNEESDLNTWLPEDPGCYLPLHHHYGPVVPFGMPTIGGQMPPPPLVASQPPLSSASSRSTDQLHVSHELEGSKQEEVEEESLHGPALDLRTAEWREVLKHEITRRDGPGCAISKLPSLSPSAQPSTEDSFTIVQQMEPLYCTQVIPESHDTDRFHRFKALATVFFAGKYDSLLESAGDTEPSTFARRGSGSSSGTQPRRKSLSSHLGSSRRGHYPMPGNILRSSRNVINLSEKWMKWLDEGRFVLRERYGQFYVRCMDPELARDPSFTRQTIVSSAPTGPELGIESVDGVRLDIGATLPVSPSSRETKHIPASLPPSSYSNPWDHSQDSTRHPQYLHQQRHPYHQELPSISSVLSQQPHPPPHSHGATVSIHTLPPFHNPLPTPNPTPPSPPLLDQHLYRSPPSTFRTLPKNYPSLNRGDNASDYGVGSPTAAWNPRTESEFSSSPSQGSSRRSATHSRWRSQSEFHDVITPSTSYSASNQSHASPGSKRLVLPGPFAAGRASREVYLHSRSSSGGRGGIGSDWRSGPIPGSVTASLSLTSPPPSASSSRKHSLSSLLNPQSSSESLTGRRIPIKSPDMIHQMLPPRHQAKLVAAPSSSSSSQPRMTLPQPKIPVHSMVGATGPVSTVIASGPPRKELWDVDALDPNLVRMHEEIMITWWSTGLAREMANQIREVDEARPLECMNVVALGEQGFTDHLKHQLSLL